MALQQGFYALRQGPALGVGGMYVTGGNMGDALFTGAQVPPLFLKQSWAITPVDHKKDMYTIVLSDSSNTTAGFGTRDAKVADSEPVVLVAQPQSWRIVKSETTDVSDAYEIHADTCNECPDLVISVPGVGDNKLKLVTLDSVKNNVPYFKFYGPSN